MISLTTGANRLKALRAFAVTITVFTLLGHLFLGFEASYVQPLFTLAATYGCELLLEALAAHRDGRAPRYHGGIRAFIEFLLPAHISGLSIAMILFPGERIIPLVFAAAVAIGSKYLFAFPVDGRRRHFLNPSNAAILATLMLFPDVCIAPVWVFLSKTTPAVDVLFPAAIFVLGFTLNFRFTKKVPLIAAWLMSFLLQGLIRKVVFDTNFLAVLVVATGPLALIFTFYMVSDPGTTPTRLAPQVVFGTAVGLLYGSLVAVHLIYPLFWSLFLVCAVRGAYCFAGSRRRQTGGQTEAHEPPRPAWREAG